VKAFFSKTPSEMVWMTCYDALLYKRHIERRVSLRAFFFANGASASFPLYISLTYPYYLSTRIVCNAPNPVEIGYLVIVIFWFIIVIITFVFSIVSLMNM